MARKKTGGPRPPADATAPTPGLPNWRLMEQQMGPK